MFNTFDDSEAIINPKIDPKAPKVDACILTFSDKVQDFVLQNYKCEKIGGFSFATGYTPIYQLEYNGRKFAFYKTYVGAPACVGTIEESLSQISTNKYILVGGAGCLNKGIARGKIMVPTAAYRDEGTSGHYTPSDDNYIKIKNANQVADFMKDKQIPYVMGKTWTTDSFYRETVNKRDRLKADGCISVEMEGAAVQAVCDFRHLEVYMFFLSGDLLDAPKWTERLQKNQIKNTQHDGQLFNIALELATYIAEKSEV